MIQTRTSAPLNPHQPFLNNVGRHLPTHRLIAIRHSVDQSTKAGRKKGLLS